ncbi:Crp/Fnr family transcriptional regulator [Sinosporangium siamense]|uniref:Crp/Fnr family transcriptional regulator n=2 Tax=Sinosporangium siamense TaxID=1367973 RepID=A0A919RJU9_9ACTN|nr:Crp/Fnr family transcriptional regulator [Sinosporangium siamense]
MTFHHSPEGNRGWSAGTLLARMAEDDRRGLLELSTPRVYSGGHELIRQGEPSGPVYLLLDALVTVTASVENGIETLIGIGVSGDIVGEMAVIDDCPRFASVTLCRKSLVGRIPGPAFMGYLQRHPSVPLVLGRILSDRLRHAHRRRLEFTGYDVDIRLARALLELARLHGRRQPEGLDIGVPLSQAELGALIGATEGSVQRALRQLAARSWVRTKHRGVLITNHEALTRFAELATEP